MAKKVHHEEHENLERWLVSYADFITLLFAFFTILYALGQTDKAKYKQAIESIQRSFTSAGGVYPLKGSPFTAIDKPSDKGNPMPASHKEKGQYSQEEMAAMEKIADQVRGVFQKSTGLNAKSDDVQVVRSPEGFKIRLGEALLFKPGSEKIARDNAPFLYEMGRRLAMLELPIQIEGHADSSEGKGRKPASPGSDEAFQLSLNRAYNLVRFLVEGPKFPKTQISLAGFGDTQPIADSESPEGRSKNRRVEISVFTPDHEVTELPW